MRRRRIGKWSGLPTKLTAEEKAVDAVLKRKDVQFRTMVSTSLTMRKRFKKAPMTLPKLGFMED